MTSGLAVLKAAINQGGLAYARSPYPLRSRPGCGNFAKTSVYRVILYDDTWNTHVIVQHPELRQNESKVEATLLAPTSIYSSKNVVGSLLYVKSGIDDGHGRLLRVVVRPMRPGTDGFVATAYFSSSNGGRLLWP
jgi:hypothetical protein